MAKLIGTNQAPKDLLAKVTGRSKYAEDFRADGMVFAKLLLSPVPRGRVRGLNSNVALGMDGVLGIATWEDLEPVEGNTEPVLTNAPRYQGQPIAAIAAVDETTAAEAVAALRLDIERLPHVLDPLDSLRPGGPNALDAGNAFPPQGGGGGRGGGAGRGGAAGAPQAPPPPSMVELKWTADRIAAIEGDRFPDGDFEGMNGFEVGDLAAGFAASAVVIEEPIVYQSHSHHPLEPRSSMAYWQNGKCYLHCSTQSAARTHAGHANRLGLEQDELVLIAEYCGGGFGSKIGGTVTDVIPAMLSRKINRPVMMRISREEETYFGRARPGLAGWVKMGFRADGRVLALDLLLIQDNGPFGPQGDRGSAGQIASLVLQAEAMRFRSIAVPTNTPPRAAQRGPGGAQIIPMLTPVLERAARQLNVDRLDMMALNAPEGQAPFGPANQQGVRGAVTSAFTKEAIALARERFGWDQKKALSGRVNGSKVTGLGVSISPYNAGSRGMDGMLVIRPDGLVTIHTGIGNLGTHSLFDTSMAAAEQLGVPWEEVTVVWGDSSKGLPWSSSQSGSQTTHAHTRANLATGQQAKLKLQEIAARDLGGAPADYEVDGRRVFRRSSPSTGMTFAQAARRAIQLGGKYDGHELEESLNAMTVAAVQTHLMGQGLVAAATDQFGGQGSIMSTVVSIALIELDRETGVFDVKEMLSVADCGTVLNPRNLEAQTYGGVLQGMSHARYEKWSFDPRWGINSNKRFHTVKPFSILDVPDELSFAAVDIPDPQNPVGSRGIGEPPVGAGAGVIVSAVYDAIGVPINRTPLTPDKILNAIEGGSTGYTRLQTHV
jgi:xanthine dehydrogenase molybdenum-binding subunit